MSIIRYSAGSPHTALRLFVLLVCTLFLNACNLASPTSKPSTVSGGTPPTITRPPLTKLGIIGQPVSFSVVAEGPGALTYEWKHRGVVIPNAHDATLTLTPTGPATAGPTKSLCATPPGSRPRCFS